MTQENTKTLKQRLAQANGQPTGFDLLRIGLALAIFAYHSIVTSIGDAAQQAVRASIAGALIDMLLPMFFALSGYLVAGSLLRAPGVINFLGMRVLRIFPALAVDTLFCALVLGPIFTTLALNQYAASPVTHAYLLNMLGIIHYELPGVFEANPMPLVNGQLWTLPAELECYLVLGAIGAVGLHRRRHLVLLTFIACLVLVEMRLISLGANKVWWDRLLLLSFLAAVVLRLYHDRTPWRASWVVGSLMLTLMLVREPLLAPLCSVTAAYATVGLGLTNSRRHPIVAGGDYSYGIFLYGFAIQQAVVAALPAARLWWVNLLVSFPLTLVFAYLSWHIVERPALSLKRFLRKSPPRLPADVAAPVTLSRLPATDADR